MFFNLASHWFTLITCFVLIQNTCSPIFSFTLTLRTKALRSKRREVFFVYFRQLKNRLCCKKGKQTATNPYPEKEAKRSAKNPFSSRHCYTTGKRELRREDREQNLDVDNNVVEHKFQEWTVKKLKDFVGQRGVTTAKYKELDLIGLARAAEETKLPVDPDFANDSLKACLEERLTLPAGKKIDDPFQMTHLSKDMSSRPSFWPFRHLQPSNCQ